jgi:hypothetical protein
MPEHEVARLLAAIYEKPRFGTSEPGPEARLTARALRYYADYMEGLAVRFPDRSPAP